MPVSPGGVQASFMLNNAWGGVRWASDQLQCILTDIQIVDSVNTNVMYAADGRTFLHVPGDKIGTAKVTGLAFRHLCNSINTNSNASPTSLGVEDIYQFYHAHKVSSAFIPSEDAETQAIIAIMQLKLGASTVRGGYLTEFTLGVSDLPSALFTFGLTFLLSPES
jgi:hypothetical protein